MSRRWLTGLAVVALVFVATRAVAQEEAAPPPAEVAAPPPDQAPPVLQAPPPAEAAPPVLQAPPPAAPQPARVPIAKRWWFWAGLGAAAVGVVLAAIALAPPEPYTGNASPGVTSVF
jgi:hypothetical protein